jgi:multidrug resistance efflux pump
MDNTLKEAEQKIEQVINKAETGLEKAEKKIVQAEKSILQNKWVRSAGAVALVVVICGGFLYWQTSSTRVSIDTSLISAPLINLSPTAPGQLKETYVNEGDMVAANTAVAKVGDEIIKTQVAGEIVGVQKDTGKNFNPGEAVVTMIDPGELRIIGTIDENKGLSKIHVGQLANFTVDAFGSKVYSGVVDEVSPTAHATDVVFNISDSRPTQQFDIKVRFDQTEYPELKNGMSAKLTIFTK